MKAEIMKTAYTNCTILDGSKAMKLTSQMTIIVEDGKITAIEKDNQLPKDFHAVNLEGRYLMPGLINLHAHLPST